MSTMEITERRGVVLPPSKGEESAVGLSVPLVLGPLRGDWWQLASGGKLMRMLLGTYEREQSDHFQQHIRPGEQVLDIGAAAGYYTLLAARLVGATGHVFAFEPDPSNLRYLRSHVWQNRLKNVTVLPIALAETRGTARFGGGTGSGTCRLCDDGCHEVELDWLDDVAERESLAPQHIKIDVEGSELSVLRGGEQLIRRRRPTIYLSTHEEFVPGIHHACCELLEAWSYRIEPIVGSCIAETTELLCTPNRE